MSISTSTQGERIRSLFRDASEATIIAPFMKIDALHSILKVIPKSAPIRCVTRWIPSEVAARVSDPKILDILREREAYELLLVDRLHAKLYIADSECLVGSANVTLAALGETPGESNIEVLVSSSTNDPGVRQTLADIESEATTATDQMAETVLRMADALMDFESPPPNQTWHPFSRKPEDAYRIYSIRHSSYMTRAERVLLRDIALADLRPGLDEESFRYSIRALLTAIPTASAILSAPNDELITRADATVYLKSIRTDDFDENDLWLAFVKWMSHFFDDKVMIQEISEIALRKAVVIPIR
ncbi:MAG: phospholipase D family protein [Gammaproteobacteria bacterium]|nr:phospholipase D family protein [Gammaproteobacteria bacterium]